MTNEEALNWFKDDLKNGKCSDECPQCNAMEKAIEAVEKQIPKKPRASSQSGFFWCPSCERAIKRIIEDSKINISYCPFCGRALDWSDTNG